MRRLSKFGNSVRYRCEKMSFLEVEGSAHYLSIFFFSVVCFCFCKSKI